jgi:hypothetical protein
MHDGVTILKTIMATPQELLAEEGITINEVYSTLDIDVAVIDLELAYNYVSDSIDFVSRFRVAHRLNLTPCCIR